MKPSVHLREDAGGRRWVGCCPDGPDPGNFIRHGSGDFLVGRGRACDIRLTDHTVSLEHAVLRVVDASLHVQDHDSTNGTYLNGARVEGWQEARPGDRIEFGSLAMSVLWVGEGQSPIAPEHLAWNDGMVVKLAVAIREEQSWADLPVLADALEESGCTDRVLLSWFRRAERSGVGDYFLELLPGGNVSGAFVHGRPMARCPLPDDMTGPIAEVLLF